MNLGDAAVRFAQAGIPIFPLVPGGKIPLTSNGLYAATTDLAQIKAWWARTSDANIGMPTGASCGWDVLDVDPASKHDSINQRADGWEALRVVQQTSLLPDPILTVRTPSGGGHLYYRAREGARNGSMSSHGLDYRAAGGYVVVPPSRTPDGTYVTVEGPVVARAANECPWHAVRQVFARPAPVPIAPSRRPISSASRIERRVAALTSKVAEAAAGNRNNVLYWAARVAITEGLDCLPSLRQAAVVAGLTDEEAARTIASAERAHMEPTRPTADSGTTTPVTYIDMRGNQRTAASVLDESRTHMLVTINKVTSHIETPGYGLVDKATGRMIQESLYQDRAIAAFKEASLAAAALVQQEAPFVRPSIIAPPDAAPPLMLG